MLMIFIYKDNKKIKIHFIYLYIRDIIKENIKFLVKDKTLETIHIIL